MRIGCADIDLLRIYDIAMYGRAFAISAAVLDFEAGVAAKVVDDVLTAGRIAAKRCVLRGGERRWIRKRHELRAARILVVGRDCATGAWYVPGSTPACMVGDRLRIV